MALYPQNSLRRHKAMSYKSMDLQHDPKNEPAMYSHQAGILQQFQQQLFRQHQVDYLQPPSAPTIQKAFQRISDQQCQLNCRAGRQKLILQALRDMIVQLHLKPQ